MKKALFSRLKSKLPLYIVVVFAVKFIVLLLYVNSVGKKSLIVMRNPLDSLNLDRTNDNKEKIEQNKSVITLSADSKELLSELEEGNYKEKKKEGKKEQNDILLDDTAAKIPSKTVLSPLGSAHKRLFEKRRLPKVHVGREKILKHNSTHTQPPFTVKLQKSTHDDVTDRNNKHNYHQVSASSPNSPAESSNHFAHSSSLMKENLLQRKNTNLLNDSISIHLKEYQREYSKLNEPKRRSFISRTSEGNLFENYDVTNPPLYRLSSDLNKDFKTVGINTCYIHGTAFTPRSNNSHGCLCQKGWHGRYCSLPNTVYFSSAQRYTNTMVPRKYGRRIINALPFNMEFEHLEARLYDLHDIVDVFVITESNFSNFGESKPLRLLDKLRQGYLQQFHSKISYVFLDHFHEEGRQNGWLATKHQLDYLGVQSMKQIIDTNPDDLYIYTDADEIPSRESLLFLKQHDGYPEPFRMALRWSVFGFFWKQSSATEITVGSTLSMFKYVFHNAASELRGGISNLPDASLVNTYKKTGALVYEWTMGDNKWLAGWHCSWCFTPANIRIKLISAVNADFPRWGSYPSKLNLTYIKGIVQKGLWFDDKTSFDSEANMADDFYAPPYFMKYHHKYKYLMQREVV